jgi:hypothetical protein
MPDPDDDRPLSAEAQAILRHAVVAQLRLTLPSWPSFARRSHCGRGLAANHPAFSFERHDPPLPPRQRTPSPGAWPSSYSGFGSAAGAASAGTAVTAGASSAGGASTAGSAGFTTSTAGSSGVVIAITVSSGIAITPREVGENRRGHLPRTPPIFPVWPSTQISCAGARPVTPD